MIVLIWLVGTALGAAVLALGVWIGRIATRPVNGDVLVSWREFWRHGPSPAYRLNRRAMYVLYGGMAVVFVAERFTTSPLMALVIGVWLGIAFGAVVNLHVRT